MEQINKQSVYDKKQKTLGLIIGKMLMKKNKHSLLFSPLYKMIYCLEHLGNMNNG